MTHEHPIPITQPEGDRILSLMVLASAAAHGVLIALVILIPPTFFHHAPPLKSYTVDLIAPDHVGGSNIIAGGKGRVEGAPMVAAAKPEPPKPPPKAEEPKPPEPKPAVPKPAVERVEPAPEPPKAVAKVEPKPEPPKPEPKPKEEEAVLAETVKKVAPPPTVAKAPPTPQAKPAVSPKAVAKAERPKAKPQRDAKAAAGSAKVSKEAATARALDDRIAAAVKNVEAQVGKRGGGSGTKVAERPGGRIAVGPGEGAGGEVKGVQYLLYYNQMISRIKQAWAWAGANRTLEASVRFNISETGDVFNVRITHASGDPSYDASVERAVRGASPLSPPPESYRKEFSDVELIFRPDDLKM